MLLNDDLKKLVAFCRKNGVSAINSGDFEITIHASAMFPESAYKQKKKLDGSDEIKVDEPFTPEDALFWSSTGIPEQSGAQ